MTEPRKRKTEPAPAPEPAVLNAETAMGNAARLLHAAEMETDRELMARLNGLADSWLTAAALLAD